MTLLTKKNLLKEFFMKLVLSLLFTSLFISSVFAIEPVCENGKSPFTNGALLTLGQINNYGPSDDEDQLTGMNKKLSVIYHKLCKGDYTTEQIIRSMLYECRLLVEQTIKKEKQADYNRVCDSANMLVDAFAEGVEHSTKCSDNNKINDLNKSVKTIINTSDKKSGPTAVEK
jgi:hypothetical protein